jgi:hypothetical protein
MKRQVFSRKQFRLRKFLNALAAFAQAQGDYEGPMAVVQGGIAYFDDTELAIALDENSEEAAEGGDEGADIPEDAVARLETGFTLFGDFTKHPLPPYLSAGRLANLHEYYLDGPAAIIVEVTQPGSEIQDRHHKRELYQRAGVPEYWLFDPFAREAIFWCRQEDGTYHPVPPDEDGVYRSAAVRGLALSLPELWSMTDTDWSNRWRPFLPCGLRHAEPLPPLSPAGSRREGDLGWDSVPFVPRVDLAPCRIRFEEFVSWCGRAKFENYGGGLKIGGSEATRRVFGMLLMTFGLTETVKLAHPRDWVAFLAPELNQATVDRHVAALLRQAVYEARDGIRDETVYSAEILDIDALTTYADSKHECREELARAVRDWVRLRLARGEELPALGG